MWSIFETSVQHAFRYEYGRKSRKETVCAKILIIDDSKMARQIVKRSLELIFAGTCVEVSSIGDAERAIELCRTQIFSVVFLDLTMPRVSGYDVLHRFHEEEIQQRVIVLSADIQSGAREAVLALGAEAFLEKPFEQEEAKKLLVAMGIV